MERIKTVESKADSANSLSELISPKKHKEFFIDYWDNAPVYFTGQSGRYNSVMTQDDFVSALFDAKLSSPSLRYLQKSIGDRQASLDFFLRKKAGWTEAQSLDSLARDLRGGTIVYVGIENVVASVKSWCRSLFTDFKCKTSVNAYFSAGRDASAFDAHFDPQDVFILQLAGEKEWQLWERERVCNPISGFPDNKSVPQPALPADETVLLTPGDLLYVPRGTWHWPRSLGDEPSLHLTLTLVMPTPIDILQWLTQIMSEQEEFRSALPFSQHQDGAAAISDSLDRAIEFLTQKLASPDAKSMATAYMLREAVRTVMPAATPVKGKDKQG